MSKRIFKSQSSLDKVNIIPKFSLLALVILAMLIISGCETAQSGEIAQLPTLAVVIATLPPETATPADALPPTFTPVSSNFESPTPVGEFVVTARPTNTPFNTLTPTPTNTPIPTNTPVPTPTPIPTNTPPPTPTNQAVPTVGSVPAGANLLSNPSFEMGFYNKDNVIELQIPNLWQFEYEAGANPLDPEDWNDWVRPEVRVLTKADIPPHEHGQYFVSSNQTVKIFKGYGSVSYRLTQNRTLPPGKYQFTVHVFPDMVMQYTASAKIYADDYRAAELSFLANGAQSQWQFVPIGRRSTYGYTFEVDQEKTVQIGLAGRGRWALENNGWFIDGFSLVKIE